MQAGDARFQVLGLHEGATESIKRSAFLACSNEFMYELSELS